MGRQRKQADGKLPHTHTITHTAPMVRCRNRYGETIWMSPELAMNAAAAGAVTLVETEGKPE